MGLTPISTWTFYWVSQLGMLAGHARLRVRRHAARDEFEESLAGLLDRVRAARRLSRWSPRRSLDAIKARKVYAKWHEAPAHFDRNLVVIGAGSAGLVSAYIAAAVKAKVTLIEKHRMGGDCLNTGCVPSKALIRSAKLLSHMRALAASSASTQREREFDFADVMERVQRVITDDRAARFGRALHRARRRMPRRRRARSPSPWTVEVETAAGRNDADDASIVIAAGARPFVPPIPGLDRGRPSHVGHGVESARAAAAAGRARRRPDRLRVGAGFARLGSKVTQVEMLPRMHDARGPRGLASWCASRFAPKASTCCVDHKAIALRIENGEKAPDRRARRRARSRSRSTSCCVAVGRVANTERLRPRGARHPGHERRRPSRPTNTCRRSTRTSSPAATWPDPTSSRTPPSHRRGTRRSMRCSVRSRSSRPTIRVIPWATFTDPEVARVGLNETGGEGEEASRTKSRVYGIDDLDRAIADGEAHGFVKVLTAPGQGQDPRRDDRRRACRRPASPNTCWR